jgi:hypothetical protein
MVACNLARIQKSDKDDKGYKVVFLPKNWEAFKGQFKLSSINLSEAQVNLHSMIYRKKSRRNVKRYYTMRLGSTSSNYAKKLEAASYPSPLSPPTLCSGVSNDKMNNCTAGTSEYDQMHKQCSLDEELAHAASSLTVGSCPITNLNDYSFVMPPLHKLPIVKLMEFLDFQTFPPFGRVNHPINENDTTNPTIRPHVKSLQGGKEWKDRQSIFCTAQLLSLHLMVLVRPRQ